MYAKPAVQVGCEDIEKIGFVDAERRVGLASIDANSRETTSVDPKRRSHHARDAESSDMG